MISGGIQEEAGSEQIPNRLDEIEEGKDPEWGCAEVDKYATYDLRGFGSPNVELGRGLFGLELQKSLRRQAYAPKHRLWGLKTRKPLTNSLIHGIALVSCGSEDGPIGHTDAILLHDCFPWAHARSGNLSLPKSRKRNLDVRPQPCTYSSKWPCGNQCFPNLFTEKSACGIVYRPLGGCATSMTIAQSFPRLRV